jgi:hypothetical protein
MQDRFYVYEHARKDSGEVFYVGKGVGHRAHVGNRHHRSEWWCRTAEKAGGFDVTFIARNLDEELAFLVEIERIDQRRRTGSSLCNLTDGGEGASGCIRTLEWRRKMGDAHRGKVISEATRRRLSESVKKAGYRHSEDALNKMRAARKGRQPTLGKTHSVETRQKMSLARIGNKSRSGQVQSEAERLAKSRALTGRVQGLLTCPHCRKTGGNAMRRWHFDACKEASK